MQRLSRKRFLVINFSVFMLALIYVLSDVQAWISDHIRLPADFAVRSRLGLSPQLDERIKIYAFDDKTVYALGYSDLSLSHWSSLITYFASQKPHAIFIDKVFGLPLREATKGAANASEIDRFQQNIRALGIPIVVGGFVSSEKKYGRQPMPLEEPRYQLDHIAGLSPEQTLDAFDHLPIEALNFYGPHQDLRHAFNTGHIVNDSYGHLKLLYRIAPLKVIPHSGFLAAGALQAKSGKFWIQGRQIPLDSDFRLIVNFPARELLYQRTKSILPEILRFNRGETNQSVRPNDIVVILPAMFTGNTDFKASPVGKIQGGYFSVAVINSILQGLWIRPGYPMLLFILFAVGLGGIWGDRATPLTFNILTPTILMGIALGGTLCFALLSFSIDWLSVSGFFGLAGIANFLERTRLSKIYSNAVMFSLQGALSPEIAKTIAKDPSIIEQEPTERIVTIMFIDIVGFSMTSERQTPKDAFGFLKTQLADMVQIIHKHQGIVDKSLGDGLLCFFGYDMGHGRSTSQHADQALACAIEIQRHSVDTIIQPSESISPIYPLRIGINSASVYLGNLGTRGRIDFTLIGNGVNFAARLENACEPFKINMGVTTYDLLSRFPRDHKSFASKKIRIKHHKKPHTCYEYDPFIDDDTKLRKAKRLYLEYHNLYSTEERWLAKDNRVKVKTQFGEGALVNFSSGGLSFKHNKNLATDTIVNLEIELAPRKSHHKNRAITATTAVICWCRPDEDGYLLGAKFNLFDELEAENFRDNLRGQLNQFGELVRVEEQKAASE